MTKNAAAYACMSCGFWGCVAVSDDEWEAHPRAAERGLAAVACMVPFTYRARHCVVRDEVSNAWLLSAEVFTAYLYQRVP